MNKLGFAIPLLAMLAAWPALAQTPDDWNAVVAAAKKEGTVTFYNGELGLACATPRVRDFEERYGVKVEKLDARSTELDQRIISEQAAGKFTGDVEMNGGPGMSRAEAQGRLQPHGDIPNMSRLLPQFKGDASWFDVEVIPYTILVNTDEVKPADMPTGWMDLINPKWKGKILSDDLRLLGVGVTTFAVLTAKVSKEWGPGMAKQELTIDRDPGNDAKRVARGEYWFFIPQQSTFIPNLAGLPVTSVIPKEGSPYHTLGIGMLKNAPHPNAARLLMNHMLDPKWQTTCATGGAVNPSIANAADTSTDYAKRIGAQTLLGSLDYDPAKQQEWVAQAKELFK